jgi:hypothetical protein
MEFFTIERIVALVGGSGTLAALVGGIVAFIKNGKLKEIFKKENWKKVMRKTLFTRECQLATIALIDKAMIEAEAQTNFTGEQKKKFVIEEVYRELTENDLAYDSAFVETMIQDKIDFSNSVNAKDRGENGEYVNIAGLDGAKKDLVYDLISNVKNS